MFRHCLTCVCLLATVLCTGRAIYTPTASAKGFAKGGRGGGGGGGGICGSSRSPRGGTTTTWKGSRGVGGGRGRGGERSTAFGSSRRGATPASGAGTWRTRGGAPGGSRGKDGGLKLREEEEKEEEDDVDMGVPERGSRSWNRAPSFLREGEREDEISNAEFGDGEEPYKVPGKGYLDPRCIPPDRERIDRYINDPECGLPTDEELQEIFRRYKEGLPLDIRQSVWFECFSDPITIYRKAANMRRNRQGLRDVNESIAAGMPPLKVLNDQLPLGCMDLENCTDCIQRYNGTAWHFPPEEDLPQNSEEERAIVEENFERYKEEYDKMWNDGTDTLGEFGFDIEGSKPTPGQYTEEYEARNLIHVRMMAVRDSGVTDAELKQALRTVNPHMFGGRNISKADLSAEMARLRKRMDHPIDDVMEGEVCDAEVTSTRPYGAIVRLAPSTRQALVHISQMSEGFCTAMPDRIRSNASDGEFIEDIKVGDTIRVMILKVDPMMHYSIEASRKSCLPKAGGGVDTAGSSYGGWQRGDVGKIPDLEKKAMAAKDRRREEEEESAAFADDLDMSAEKVIESILNMPSCGNGGGWGSIEEEGVRSVVEDEELGEEVGGGEGAKVVHGKRKLGLNKGRKRWRDRDVLQPHVRTSASEKSRQEGRNEQDGSNKRAISITGEVP